MKVVTYWGSLVQLCCGEGGALKQISLMYVGSTPSVGTTLGLPQLTATCAFWVYTAQTPGCYAGHCPKQTLHFVHFPSLNHSGSGSRELRKGTDSVEHVFCAFSRSEQLGRSGAWWVHCPWWAAHLNHLPGPGQLVPQVHLVSTISDVLCVSSGELTSGCDPPGRCRPSQEDSVSNWKPSHSLMEDSSLWGRDWSSPLGSDCLSPASLPPVGWRDLYTAG